MTLFDEMPRSELGPRRRDQPLFDYYNTTARPPFERVRAQLNTWSRRFPTEGAGELRQRIRSGNSGFLSAFFELYLHELFCAAGYRLQYHPEVPGTDRHPDFLAAGHGVSPFYVEATLAQKSQVDASAVARLEALYATLEGIESPNFFLGIQECGGPTTPPPGRRWRPKIERWLATLDPDELAESLESAGFEGLPTIGFEHEGYSVSFVPILKSPALREKPGIRPLGFQQDEIRVLTPHKALRAAIKSKSTRYGELELPYLVAVNVIEDYVALPHEIDIGNALFGEECMYATMLPDGTVRRAEGRVKNGAWFGPQGPQNTRCSAALIAIGLHPEDAASNTPVIYHNPWAQRPMIDHPLQLSAKVPDAKRERMIRVDGRPASAILGLAKDWPFWETDISIDGRYP